MNLEDPPFVEKIVLYFKENILLFILFFLLSISLFDTLFKLLIDRGLRVSLSYFYLNSLSFGMLFFLFLFLLHIFSEQRSIKGSVIKLSSIFWLFCLSPILTMVFGGEISHLNIMRWSDIVEFFLFANDLNTGLIIIFLVSGLLGVIIARDNENDHLERVFSSVGGVLLSIICFVLFFQLGLTGIQNSDISSVNYNKHLGLLLSIYLVQLMIVISAFATFLDKKRMKKYLSNMKLFRSLHFAMMVLIGLVVLSRSPYRPFNVFDQTNITFFFLAPLMMVFTWQFTAMVNDIYDREIDRLAHPERPLITGEIRVKNYKNIAICFAVVSLLISFYFGILLMLLNLSFIIAAILYSVPPIRLKERIFAYLCVGYASAVAFLSGFYSPVMWSLIVEHSRFVSLENIPVPREVLSISLIIFMTLSVSPYINALSDFEGDKRAGVKNIYTIYGREKGKKIVGALVVLLFLSPLSLFPTTIDLLLMLPLSLVAFYFYYVLEEHRFIFILYFLIIIFYLTRYLGLVSI